MKTREKVKLFFLFIFYCVITQQVFAQKRTISGTVTSAEVAVSGTMNCASGKLTVTWKYTVPSLDGDGNEVEGEVQTKTETVEVQ